MAPASHIPVLQAILLCDQLYQDKATNKFVIAGTFTRILAATFPAQHPVSFLYFRVVDWAGKSSFRFRLVDLKDASLIGESGPFPIELAEPQRLSGQEFGVRLPPLPLAHDGAYALELLWGDKDHPLGQWRFDVVSPKENG